MKAGTITNEHLTAEVAVRCEQGLSTKSCTLHSGTACHDGLMETLLGYPMFFIG